MKKLISVLLMVIITVSMVACSQAQKPADKKDTTTTETKSVTEKKTETPTEKTTEKPTQKPTQKPTKAPTQPPTKAPTKQPVSYDAQLFSNMSGEYVFSSGVGAWATMLEVNSDGSFTGLYSDSNMGETGDGYPYGTVYYCSFYGAFKNPKKINSYTYSIELSYLEYENTVGTEEYIDNRKYIYTDAYGVYGTDKFYVYTPDAQFENLPDEFLSWLNGSYGAPGDSKLGRYGIYNINKQYGLIGDPI